MPGVPAVIESPKGIILTLSSSGRENSASNKTAKTMLRNKKTANNTNTFLGKLILTPSCLLKRQIAYISIQIYLLP
jgi:hypothetical protein